ncbi:uncharacterized protein ACA1_168940 [Acanthamoeba castellanii str. Neff]|uniref:Uncharacterized protein n=1 Tax=Acanthamoeba castellanii (strain ATCC 30010 / Neff) TaxID=1257118 RepID=L8HIN3_ACACF|nr:uncharacterized protein ACA1_168940 [Acanthamoeba castellanii str. Neff]ELR24256.1 hypothetical protein ACA1_168940 [Acanthamoeba castellanii str. Neff]
MKRTKNEPDHTNPKILKNDLSQESDGVEQESGKRGRVPCGLGYVASMSDKADLHQAVRHQTMAGILGQLSTLLSYANELYADLHRELSNDAQRISALAARTQAAYDYLPHLETYIHNTGPEEFINRGGSEYKQKGGEDCQLLSPGTRATATVVVYDTECVPPPDLSPLDPYREDGRPCIKDYTNPAFFVEEWIAEQKRQAQEARRRREKSRKTKQDERGVLRRANEAVEVKKLKKTRYNQWGEKIQDGDDDGAVAAPSREATKSAPRVEATTAPKELTESSKGHKKREKKTLFKGKEKEKEKEQRESERKGSTDRPPPRRSGRTCCSRSRPACSSRRPSRCRSRRRCRRTGRSTSAPSSRVAWPWRGATTRTTTTAMVASGTTAVTTTGTTRRRRPPLWQCAPTRAFLHKRKHVVLFLHFVV